MNPDRIHEQLSLFPLADVLASAGTDAERKLIKSVAEFREQEHSVNYLHSALCSMSLPTRRPANEYEPILRRDGRYTLLISPRSYPSQEGVVKVGVPFGAKARLVLIQIMTESVRTNSRHVFLGKSLSHWMRRLGYKSFSGGPEGTMTLFREQVRRLSRCEWTIRRDEEGEASQLVDVRLTDDLLLWATDGGDFIEEIALNEHFHEHLKEHAVPLNEAALAQLRESPTALDLYVWLVYRLPRLTRPSVISWQQLAVHFGNDYANLRQFRYELRKVLPKVLAMYPGAKVDMSDGLVRLYPSPPAVERTRVALRAPHLASLPAPSKPAAAPVATPAVKATDDVEQAFVAALKAAVEPATYMSWFAKGRLTDEGEGLVFRVETGFAADWIRNHFSAALDGAARAIGLATIDVVSVRSRSRPAPSAARVDPGL